MVSGVDRPDALSQGERRLDRRRRTRERMLAATIAILRSEGVGAISVSRVAKRVGVHHSLFYAHFKNVDDCLAAAAEQVLRTLAPVDRELRRELFKRAVTDRRALARYFADAFERWLEQRPFVELLLAHRLDPSPLGEAMRPAFDAIRDELAAELDQLARQLGVDEARRGEVQSVADLHLSHWLWALEALISGRAPGRDVLADMLAEMFVATNMTFFSRATRPSREALIAERFTQAEREQLKERRSFLRQFLKAHDDASLIAAVGGLEPLCDQVLSRLCRHFLPGAARGASAVVRYRITHAKDAVERLLVIRDGECKPLSGAGEPPRITLTYGMRTWLETISGIRHMDEAYRNGDISIEGDVFFAVELIDWFYYPADLP